MSIITLTTDFGYKDYHVSALKAEILSLIPQSNVIDISHDIKKFDLQAGVFVLNNALRQFPEKTVHLFAVNESGTSKDQGHYAVQIRNQFVIGTGTRFLSLLDDKPDEVVQLSEGITSVFPSKDLFVEWATKIIKEGGISGLGSPINISSFQSDLLLQNDLIIGKVVYIDDFGNLITNIEKSKFEEARNDRNFNINFGRENLGKINENYHEVEFGEVSCLFNHSNQLEIFISVGNASRLLGLKVESKVKIDFN